MQHYSVQGVVNHKSPCSSRSVGINIRIFFLSSIPLTNLLLVNRLRICLCVNRRCEPSDQGYRVGVEVLSGLVLDVSCPFRFCAELHGGGIGGDGEVGDSADLVFLNDDCGFPARSS